LGLSIMHDFEKLGAFYLGRTVDPATGTVRPEPLLYDSRDLSTHAVCVGMTGSGKTGLCISLIEEAALDGIPVLAIDPKGDLGNLLLGFPELRPADFRPWVDPGEAARRGQTLDEAAARTAEQWREGLASSGQDGARIARLEAAAEFAIHTPGSEAGLPVDVLRSFAAPPPAVLTDPDGYGERLGSAVSGLLALLGVDADPLRSREHVLVANLVDRAWRAGEDLELGDLIRRIQNPPFARIGVLDVDTFMPPAERARLAMALNALLASPGFAAWLGGEPLDVQRLLWTDDGRPRVAILSIAHLPDAQRMFFVTLLLNEVVAWMRGQAGTSSLRAIVYMDEVFGYLPPTANPPSKLPLLTLLKQARAYGLGCVLATQNPVDLDYKALSNAGTWFLGRLQTERDQLRVLDGLAGAAASAGAGFDRAAMERTLAGLGKRRFVMHNVHEDAPLLFETRWALSYLRGPLTRTQIAGLMAGRRPVPRVRDTAAAAERAVVRTGGRGGPDGPAAGRPVVAAGVVERFASRRGAVDAGAVLVYRPALFGTGRVHIASARDGIDLWREVAAVAPIFHEPDADPWDDEGSSLLELRPGAAPQFDAEPEPGAGFAALPAACGKPASWTTWSRRLKEHLHRTGGLRLLVCPALELVSRPDEGEGAFRARCVQVAREVRDREVGKLRQKWAPKLGRLQDQLRRAVEKVEREQAQVRHQSTQAAISIGSTLLGALFGRSSRGGAASTARGASRVVREREDVARAEASLEEVRAKLAALEADFEAEVEALQAGFAADRLEFSEKWIAPRKADLVIHEVALLWTPWVVHADGRSEPRMRELG
jgi:hypothetical protein